MCASARSTGIEGLLELAEEMLDIGGGVVAVDGNAQAASVAHDVHVMRVQLAVDRFECGVTKSDDAGDGVGIVGGEQFDGQPFETVETGQGDWPGGAVDRFDA